MPKSYVLLAPWEMFDPPKTADGTGRRPLALQKPVEVPGGRSLYLAVPAGVTVDVKGHRLGAQRETNDFKFGPHHYSLYSLSVGTRDQDATLSVELDNEDAGQILIRGHMPRPSWSLGRDAIGPRDARQGRLDLYLLGLVDLIRLVEDPAVAWHESGWKRLSEAWTGNIINMAEPPMALIVRHADTLQRMLSELGRYPRRILSRTRSMTPVDRVQQLDIPSVRWLSKQPGKNIYERAGPRQRILAVRRFENLDTLENRVLHDLADRSYSIAAAYAAQYETLNNSSRWKQVDQYRRGCGRLSGVLRDAKIGKPRPPIKPNHPLMQERRYKQVWRAHREIIRRLDEQDECWRWQHRLWADFCRLVTQVALHRRFRPPVAESPLRIAQEQRRGQWSEVDVHSGSYLIPDESGNPAAVLSMIWDIKADHPKIQPWMASLGPAAVLHIQSLQDGSESYILVWAVHVFGDEIPELNKFVDSAQRALHTCLNELPLYHNIHDVRARALALVSDINPQKDGNPRAEGGRDVIAQRLNAGYGNLRRNIDTLGDTLEFMARRLVKNVE